MITVSNKDRKAELVRDIVVAYIQSNKTDPLNTIAARVKELFEILDELIEIDRAQT